MPSNNQPVVGNKVKMVRGTENQVRKIGAIADIKFIDDNGSFLVKWDGDNHPRGNLWLEPPVDNVAQAHGLPLWFELLEGSKS